MEKQQELRAYFFQNMYLHGIHAGIQSQHTTAEMFIKYEPVFKSHPKTTLHEWASNHKTTIVLNGGMQLDLEMLQDLLEEGTKSGYNSYPWAYFNEADFALNGALTNVGIILPDRIFKAPFISEEFDGGEEFEQYSFENNLSEWEITFIKVLKSKKLMS